MNIINPNARALYGAFQLPTRRWDSRGHQMLMNKRRTSILRTLLITIVATVMLALPQHAQAQTKEAYAVKSADGKTLTFYYDTLKASRQGTVWGIDSVHTDKNGTFPIWAGTFENPDSTLAKVVFDLSFKYFRPKTTSCWFFNCNALKQIMGMENLNTSEVTDMDEMFSNCNLLTVLDLRSFDTRNVTKMNGMFFGCLALTRLDLTRFDTRNVTNMSHMFFYCLALPVLDVTKFDTRNVTDMFCMFGSCMSLTHLDVSKFDTRNVTRMDEMFSSCSSLTELDLRSFDTRNVTNIEGMFSACLSLTKIYSKDERIGKLKKKFKQMREKPVTTPEELRTYLRNNY